MATLSLFKFNLGLQGSLLKGDSRPPPPPPPSPPPRRAAHPEQGEDLKRAPMGRKRPDLASGDKRGPFKGAKSLSSASPPRRGYFPKNPGKEGGSGLKAPSLISRPRPSSSTLERRRSQAKDG